jgi:hypothetical protein
MHIFRWFIFSRHMGSSGSSAHSARSGVTVAALGTRTLLISPVTYAVVVKNTSGRDMSCSSVTVTINWSETHIRTTWFPNIGHAMLWIYFPCNTLFNMLLSVSLLNKEQAVMYFHGLQTTTYCVSSDYVARWKSQAYTSNRDHVLFTPSIVRKLQFSASWLNRRKRCSVIDR